LGRPQRSARLFLRRLVPPKRLKAKGVGIVVHGVVGDITTGQTLGFPAFRLRHEEWPGPSLLRGLLFAAVAARHDRGAARRQRRAGLNGAQLRGRQAPVRARAPCGSRNSASRWPRPPTSWRWPARSTPPAALGAPSKFELADFPVLLSGQRSRESWPATPGAYCRFCRRFDARLRQASAFG
jgi:hypothetical protein